MNSKEFSLTIESLVKEKKVSYMDAIILYCDKNEIDVGSVGSMVSKSLKEKIKIEAINLRMINVPKGGTLPI
tara:strand:+ start:80 stop:295 length:216 start_codon:yes stop_codon:yes gene_type:complete